MAKQANDVLGRHLQPVADFGAVTLYNRWKSGGDKGIFIRMIEGLAVPDAAEHKTIMIDAIYLKAHRTASSLGVKKGASAA